MDFVYKIQEEQGWTDATLLSVVLDYIDNQKCDSVFEEYLKARCAEEQEEPT